MSAPAWVVPLSDVEVDATHVEAVVETLESGWWSMVRRVGELEAAFGVIFGTSPNLAVANGTAALHLALLAVGCGPGDEVVLPSLTFVAAANVVVHTGATPVFCDIRGERDLNLDPDDLEAALSEKTRAVVTLDYGGFACDADAVRAVTEPRGIAVV